MKKYLSLILILLLGILIIPIQSCNKDDDQSDPSIPKEIKEGPITGKVILPTGSTLSLANLDVASPIDQIDVINGEFTVNGYQNTFTTQYLFDANYNVVMIGYSYPGQPNNDITTRSTALALVMNTMAVFTLSSEGKEQIVNKTLKDPLFTDLVNEVEATVLVGKSITDTTNSALAQKTIALFQNVSQKISNSSTNPIEISDNALELTFTNRRTIHSVVGVYNGNNRIKKIEVDAVQRYPSSIQGWVDVMVNGTEGPQQVKYSLPGDGTYNLKVRTGLPNEDDGSIEHDEARFNNIIEFVAIVLNGLIPQFEGKTCGVSFIANIGTLIKDTPVIDQETDPKSLLNSAVQLILTTISSITEKCPKHFNKHFFQAFAQQLNLFEKYIGGASSVLNSSYFVAHWVKAESAVDTCILAKQSIVTSCKEVQCLSYPEWKMLTNGTSKSWKLVRVDWPGGITSSVAPGEKVTYTFNADGWYGYMDGWYRDASDGFIHSTPPYPGNGTPWCALQISTHELFVDRYHFNGSPLPRLFDGFVEHLILLTPNSYIVQVYHGYTCHFVAL